jgi:hypothetical protein
MMCLWTTPDQKEEEQQVAAAQEWAKDMGWKTTSGQIKNQQHDGYLEVRCTCLVAAKERVIKRLPQQFNESNDRHQHLEQILDIGDGMIKHCFSYFTEPTEDRNKPIGTGVKVKTRQQSVRKEEKKKSMSLTPHASAHISRQATCICNQRICNRSKRWDHCAESQTNTKAQTTGSIQI